MNNEKVITIISCGKRKIWDKSPNIGQTLAKDAYISNYFKLCKKYAEKFSDKWFILSAKYGFIVPDFVISSNYNVKLDEIKDRLSFIEKLKEQAEKFGLQNYDKVVVLTGKDYFNVIKRSLQSFGLEICNPLEGLGIGDRQKLLKKFNNNENKDYTFDTN